MSFYGFYSDVSDPYAPGYSERWWHHAYPGPQVQSSYTACARPTHHDGAGNSNLAYCHRHRDTQPPVSPPDEYKSVFDILEKTPAPPVSTVSPPDAYTSPFDILEKRPAPMAYGRTNHQLGDGEISELSPDSSSCHPDPIYTPAMEDMLIHFQQQQVTGAQQLDLMRADHETFKRKMEAQFIALKDQLTTQLEALVMVAAKPPVTAPTPALTPPVHGETNATPLSAMGSDDGVHKPTSDSAIGTQRLHSPKKQEQRHRATRSKQDATAIQQRLTDALLATNQLTTNVATAPSPKLACGELPVTRPLRVPATSHQLPSATPLHALAGAHPSLDDGEIIELASPSSHPTSGEIMMAKPPASKRLASRAGANNIAAAQTNRPSVAPTQSALQPRAHEQTHTVVTPKQPAPRHRAHKGPTTTNIGRRPSGPSPTVTPKVPSLVPTEPPTYGTANATRLVPNEVPLSLDRTSLGPTITSPFARRPTKQIPSALGGIHGEQPQQAPLTKTALVSPTQELTAMVSPSPKPTATMLSTPKLAAMALVHGNGPIPVTPLDFRTGN